MTGLKWGGIIAAGATVTALTGGTGWGPLYGMLAASGASAAADAEVREQVSQGNFGEAANLTSYHMPFVGPGRRMWEAAKQGDSLGMLFNSGMLPAEGVGMKYSN